MFKNPLLLSLLFLVAAFTSCVSPKRLFYFNDQVPSVQDLQNTRDFNVHLIKPNDKISVLVSCPEPSLTAYLNPLGGGGGGNTNFHQGYLVNAEGSIEFPILGKVYVQGLSTVEAAALIKEKLSYYYKDLFINVVMLGRVYYITGKSGGSVAMQNERLTVFEALTQMPNLDPYDSRNDVWLVREDSGRRYFAKLNLNSKKIFESEYYFLKNNDLLYVKPSRFTSNLFNTASPLKGIITIMGSVLALFLTIKSINL